MRSGGPFAFQGRAEAGQHRGAGMTWRAFQGRAEARQHRAAGVSSSPAPGGGDGADALPGEPRRPAPARQRRRDNGQRKTPPGEGGASGYQGGRRAGDQESQRHGSRIKSHSKSGTGHKWRVLWRRAARAACRSSRVDIARPISAPQPASMASEVSMGRTRHTARHGPPRRGRRPPRLQPLTGSRAPDSPAP